MNRLLWNLVRFLEKHADIILLRSHQLEEFAIARRLARLFNHCGVDCVYDVGANRGQYGRFLRKLLGYRGQILSFEPNQEAFKDLQRNANGDAKWSCIPSALGASAGSLELQIPEVKGLDVFASFLQLGNQEAADYQPKSSVRTARVRVETLASRLPADKARIGFQRPYLKMDTQGFDLEVARGAGDQLSQFVGLQSEIAFKRLYKDAPVFADSLAFFRAAGFEISRLNPIHDEHFPETIEMDLVMVRADFLVKS